MATEQHSVVVDNVIDKLSEEVSDQDISDDNTKNETSNSFEYGFAIDNLISRLTQQIHENKTNQIELSQLIEKTERECDEQMNCDFSDSYNETSHPNDPVVHTNHYNDDDEIPQALCTGTFDYEKEISKPIDHETFEEVYNNQHELQTQSSEERLNEGKIFNKKNIRNRIEKRNHLGSGGFADVYKCIDLDTKEEMAVKIFKKLKSKPFDEISFLKQHEIMQKIEHVNIMKLKGYEKVDDTYWSFMEYCEDYMSLSKLLGLLSEQGQQLSEEDCAYILIQVLEALQTMHEHKIMHRDIKAENVLVNINDFTVKLCDFDFAIQLPNYDSYVHDLKGTYSHMAPEMVRNDIYTFSADIYSIGCLLIEMLKNGSSLWSNANGQPLEEYHIVMQVAMCNKRPPYPNCLSGSAIDFLNKCLESNPKERASAFDLLQHPFLN